MSVTGGQVPLQAQVSCDVDEWKRQPLPLSACFKVRKYSSLTYVICGGLSLVTERLSNHTLAAATSAELKRGVGGHVRRGT